MTLSNPFFHRGPICDRAYFFGREDEVDQVLSFLANHQSISLVAQRRIGKTSLLFHIADPDIFARRGLRSDRHLFVYIDCSGLGNLDQSDLYRVFLEEIGDSLADRGLSPGRFDALNRSDPMSYRVFERALSGLARQNWQPILLLDEFERMSYNPHLDPDFFSSLRALADLRHVADALRNYQRVDLVEDKMAYLAQAIESLSRLEREFPARLLRPEREALTRIALSWLAVSTNTLQDLQGRAQLEVCLKTRQLVSRENGTVALELTNTGRSPASNLTITLLPGQGYTVAGSTVQVDILPAGRSTLVELPLSAAPSVSQFRAEFSVTFDDRERRGKRLAFADMVRLLQSAAEFRPIPNPYIPGTPLSPGSPMFFGRDDLFEFIDENMAGLARQNILVLIGQRRMGKTSFLQQLPARLGEDYMPVYLDGQSLGIDPGMANFFYDLALAIVDALTDHGLHIEQPILDSFQERPSATFERSFLPAVLDLLGHQSLLLLFDEFEELEMRVASGKLEPTIFPFLRHLMQHSRKLSFIFVGTHRLEALSSDYWSIFFNIALYKHVTSLDQEAARHLITQPVAQHGLLYDDLALDKMLRVTASYPYFLQLICHTLVNHANRERRGYLTIQDVSTVLNRMVELGEAHFAFLWDESSLSEQLSLACLSRLLGIHPTVTAAQINEELAEHGITMEVGDVTHKLRQLVERDLVREVPGQPPRYEYQVELIRMWVERHKTLEQVIEQAG